MLPRRTLVRRNDTHRLIPSLYTTDGGSVLGRIARSEDDIALISEIDALTNDRVLAEADLLPGIGIHELVFDVPEYHIVNAAFTHAHPLGSRFNGPTRGAWYAAFESETAQAEVAYHKTLELNEIGYFYDYVTYDDYLADFSAEFDDLREAREFADSLDPMSYVASQTLAEQLLQAGSLGVVYPSVRHVGGTCIACFRPALVVNARKGRTYRFTWNGNPVPDITTSRPT